jgi:tetratricopeptide (TPR) repeat protein
MNEKKVCQSCGFISFKDEVICSECGAKISNDILPEINKVTDGLLICKNCGFGNEQSFNYCGKCGESLMNLKVKNNSSKPVQKKYEKKIPLTTKLAYGILGLFVILVSIITFINKNSSFPVETANAMDNRGEVSKQIQAPKIDMMRLSELNMNLDKNPADKNSLLGIANLYHDANNHLQAISYYKKYLALEEKNADARIDMAICCFLSGDNETAITEINNALKFSPLHQKAYYNLGIISMSSGKVKESMEYFQKCYELDPKTEAGIQSMDFINQHKTVVK